MSLSFSTEILESPFLLRRFLSGEEAMKTIEARASQVQVESDELYLGRWQVVWITFSYPFAYLFSCFCEAIAALSDCFCLESPSRCLRILAKTCLDSYAHLQWQTVFGNKLLVPARGHHQFSTWDLYTTPSGYHIQNESFRRMTAHAKALEKIAEQLLDTFFKTLKASPLSVEERREVVQGFQKEYMLKNIVAAMELLKRYQGDPQWKKAIDALYQSAQNQLIALQRVESVTFYHLEGMCQGASDWFLTLYLKTKDQFATPEQALRAVAAEFVSGMPKEAAFLQSMWIDPSWYGLQTKTLEEHQASLYDLDLDQKGALEKVNALPNGVYRVGVYNHSMVFCKSDEQNGWIWNPAIGLLRGNSSDLFDHVMSRHYKKGHPHSSIYFKRFELLGSEASLEMPTVAVS